MNWLKGILVLFCIVFNISAAVAQNIRLWYPINTLPVQADFQDVYFNDNIIVVVGSKGTILTSADAGLTWNNQSIQTSKDFRSLALLQNENTLSGYAVGAEGLIAKYTNSTWIEQPAVTTQNLRSICFADQNTAFIVGDNGKILKQVNGEYQQINLDTRENLWKVHFPTANVGYITGGNGIILKTTDQGVNWMKLNLGLAHTISAIHFINNDLGFISAEGWILQTDNGGADWKIIQDLDLFIWDIDFSENKGWAVGDWGSVADAINCGTIWNHWMIEPYNDNTMFYSISIHNNKGYIAGSNGTLLVNNNATSVEDENNSAGQVQEFCLDPNYPNPFNSSTKISYQVTEPGNVSLALYSVTGQQIKQLVNSFSSPGRYTINWNGTDQNENPVSSGIYLCRLVTKGFVQTRQMVLIK